MTSDRWTFLVMHGEGSPVKQYSLSSRLLRVLIGGILAVALLLVASALAVGSDEVGSGDTALLREIGYGDLHVGQLVPQGAGKRIAPALETDFGRVIAMPSALFRTNCASMPIARETENRTV